eukprot:TRINITY_DN8950_c0_g3_i4.p1 TRINITY_DN8950_c0_g3~~TRINITY_DN8950_c0_g3_i4.p1  ORF type:complete len:476 (+),score=174.56 TRINITY_DN8950_c0_g3_i4:212-1639(+)
MSMKQEIADLSNSTLKSTASAKARADNLEAIADEYRQKINEEREKIREIEENINLFQAKIVEQKRSAGGINAAVENQSALTKQIKILEARLDKANQKFNEAIATNKHLRSEIDSLRRERVIFDNLYKKLERELHEKRKHMADIIESANTAYEERDKANDQIQGLKQQAKRDAQEFEKDLRELSQVVQRNKALDLIKVTEKGREEQTDERLETEKSKLRAQPRKAEKALEPVQVEKIAKLEEDFAKIQAATGIKSINDLVKIFVENEEKNFTMFKYVNELSNEIEVLQKTIDELKEERARYEGQSSTMDLDRKRAAKDLSERLDVNREKAERYEYKYHQAITKIGSLCNWIETAFNTIDCDKNLAKELTGATGVTESSMMTYLGIIEDRGVEILYYYAILAKPKTYDIGDTGLLSQTLKNTRNDVLEDEQSDDDIEADKALNAEELLLRAQEKLENKNKSQGAARKGRGGSRKPKK